VRFLPVAMVCSKQGKWTGPPEDPQSPRNAD
jgi:hypothetical protein